MSLVEDEIEQSSADSRGDLYRAPYSAPLFGVSVIDLLNRQQLLSDTVSDRNKDGVIVSDSKLAGKLVGYGMTAATSLLNSAGYGISPRVGQAFAVGAGLDVRSTSAPGQILEGAARLGVAIGGIAATAAVADLNLWVAGAVVGAAVGRPVGVVAGGVLGLAAPFVAGVAASSIGNYAIDQAVNLGQTAPEAIANYLTQGVYDVYGINSFMATPIVR
jgi:hypothetical protein